MPKQLLEINKFHKGTITTPDATDTPEQSASFSINLDCVNKDGALQGAPINTTKTIKNWVGSSVSPDFDKARVLKTVDSTNTVSEDVVLWENDSNKLHFLQDAQNTYPIRNPNATPFAALDGITFNETPLDNVAMEVNNKEVHLGLGNNNTPKWVGYTNHKGLNSSAKKLIVEEAEVVYPSSVPFMYKVVKAADDGYLYGIEKGGTRIWKLDGTSTGASPMAVSSSVDGTFTNLVSIASDGSGNLFVLDRVGEGKVEKVATSDLSTKAVTYTLATYAGPDGSWYSDIEYTSTGSTIWLACHYDDKVADVTVGYATQLLFKIDDSGSTANKTPVNMMPNMAGGNKNTPGTWFDIKGVQQTTIGWDEGSGGQENFFTINNTIQETFPRSLLKTNDNAAIYWLARYENSGNFSEGDGEAFYTRWLNRDSDDATSSGTHLNQVSSVSVAMTLALHRIKNNHSAGSNNTGGDFVPITSVYHPNDANGTATKFEQGIQPFTTCDITSIGVDNALGTAGEVYLTKGDAVQKCSTDLATSWVSSESSGNYNKYYLTSLDATGPTEEIIYDVAPAGQINRLGVNVHFGYVPSTASVGSAYSADGTNFVTLRQSGTSGFDKLPKTFTASSDWVFFKDNSLISLSHTPVSSTTSELIEDYTYFYKVSMMFDGYQETNPSLETFLDAGDTTDVTIGITINDKNQIPDRASGIKIYRAESPTTNATKPASVYRLVKYLTFASGWADSGTSGKTQSIVDTGTKGASYEAESGLPESIEGTLPNYSLSTQLNNQHYIGGCTHEGYVDDASSYIFVSKVGKFDIFDWVVDFIKLPTVPTALISFAGRVFAFDKTTTYRIRGGNDLYIEDIFEGVGCLNDDAVVSTDFGLFFADNNNIYKHNGQSADPIGEAIVRGDSAYSWQNRDTSYYTRAMYDATRRSVYFTFKVSGANKYGVWAWNIPRSRWDMFSFDDGSGTPIDLGSTVPKGFYPLDDNTINVSTGSSVLQFLGHATTKRQWTWVSKDLTMGNDTQEKKLQKVLISGDRLKASYSVPTSSTFNSAKPSVGNQLDSTKIRGTYRLNVDKNSTNIKIRLDSNTAGDECGAVAVLFRTKRSPK